MRGGFSAIARSVMISARNDQPSQALNTRFSAIARSVMISALKVFSVFDSKLRFSAIARSVMISAVLTDLIKKEIVVSVL